MKSYFLFNWFTFSLLLFFISQNGVAQSGSLTVNEDPRISDLLRLQKEMEKENKLSIGYTIQLYYGELNTANDVLKKYKNNAQWPASIEYETPNYKVWAGNFSTRIEAERALLALKRDFSSAFILKPDRRK